GADRGGAHLRPPEAGRGATGTDRRDRLAVRAARTQDHRDETRPGDSVPRRDVLRGTQRESVLRAADVVRRGGSRRRDGPRGRWSRERGSKDDGQDELG